MAQTEDILRVLLVESSLNRAEVIINTLRGTKRAVRASRVDTMEMVREALTEKSWELVICCCPVESVSAVELIGLIERLHKDIPCVLMMELDEVANFYNSGAKDIIATDDMDHLSFVVERELGNLANRRLARRCERVLYESERRARSLLDSSRDAVAYIHEGMHVYVNSAYLTMFGYEAMDDIEGLPILDMISAEDHAKFKRFFRHFSATIDGQPETICLNCIAADEGEFDAGIELSHARVENENCIQVVVHDKRHELTAEVEQQLKQLREYTELTGLYNRQRFMEELKHYIGMASTDTASSASLLYIELDNFQKIRDQLGGGASDIVLKELAKLLKNELSEGEIIGHYSEQTFTVLIPMVKEEEVDSRAEVFQKAINSYNVLAAGEKLMATCSIGIARISGSLSSLERVLENAERASITARNKGGNHIERFRRVLSEESSSEQSTEWEHRIKSALAQDGFCLYYQPIVSLHGDAQEIYEVLLRMVAEDGSLIQPNEFMDYARELSLLTEIDKWVVSHALTSLEEHKKIRENTRFFIKLSEQTLNSEACIESIYDELRKHHLEGESLALVFEINETTALSNLQQTQEMVNKVRDLGCEFGLEHFGTGLDFSQSLSTLEVDYLKINGAFVENMAKVPENKAAVESIIKMSKKAGTRSIAEFVSDAHSMALLWQMGVDYAQGYYIHEPSEKLDYNFDSEE